MQRYEETVGIIKHNEVGKSRYESIRYPNIRPKLTDKYIIAKRLDRLDLLAAEWYGDSRLWWVIARANNLAGGSLRIEPGTRVRIPLPIQSYQDDIDQILSEEQF